MTNSKWTKAIIYNWIMRRWKSNILIKSILAFHASARRPDLLPCPLACSTVEFLILYLFVFSYCATQLRLRLTLLITTFYTRQTSFRLFDNDVVGASTWECEIWARSTVWYPKRMSFLPMTNIQNWQTNCNNKILIL